LGFLDPVAALIVSFCILGLMLYKRVNLGITLNATALLLALLTLDPQTIPTVIYKTSIEPLTIAVVLATFGIMVLSQLYKLTGVIGSLSDSLDKILNNPKIVSSILPAIVGFLPVAGGALMSAPLVDSQTEKLGLKPEKKAYVNIWFRHTIFPVYPLGQVLVITAALTGVALPLIILRQIPVVVVMIAVGFLISFWGASRTSGEEPLKTNQRQGLSEVRRFLVAFSPILATIVVVIAIELAGLGLAGIGFDVFIATIVGIVVLLLISKPRSQVLVASVKGWQIYGVTLAAYGAFLLRNATDATEISEILKASVVNGGVDVIVLLTVVPAILGFVTGSPSGGVAISVSILSGLLVFSPKTAALLFMGAYLGYVIVPSHLCLAFTVEYFKCSLEKVYKYMIPSFLVSFMAALLVYFLA
jgi:integral membrane protein (TIGR00529 family)